METGKFSQNTVYNLKFFADKKKNLCTWPLCLLYENVCKATLLLRSCGSGAAVLIFVFWLL